MLRIELAYFGRVDVFDVVVCAVPDVREKCRVSPQVEQDGGGGEVDDVARRHERHDVVVHVGLHLGVSLKRHRDRLPYPAHQVTFLKQQQAICALARN